MEGTIADQIKPQGFKTVLRTETTPSGNLTLPSSSARTQDISPGKAGQQIDKGETPDPETVRKYDETGNRLTKLLTDRARRGLAIELNERIAAYCKIERVGNESLNQILLEMGQGGKLNSIGRALASTIGDTSGQRWRDFMRVFVEGNGRELFSRTYSVIPGMTKVQMALAMEWMMGSEIGVEIREITEGAMGDQVNPCRSLGDVMARLSLSPSTVRKMARNLIEWSEQRMPVASFLQYVQTHSRTAEEGRKARKEEEDRTDRPETLQDPKPCENFSHRTNNLHNIEAVVTTQPVNDTHSARRMLKRLVTYNLNSLIAAIGRNEGRVLEFIERNMADVIALQEIMVIN